MRYSISKAERILGISQSTLRRYEEAGLLQVRRVPQSKYRYFSTGDIARLSVYLGMRQQGFLPQELGEISKRKEDDLTHVQKRLAEIEEEIQRLMAEKVCWERHLALFELMNKVKQAECGAMICRYETMLGSWFDDEQTTYDALYFRMFREGDISRNYFRLCCIFAHQEDGAAPAYRQAYCIPLELLKREDILRIKNKVYLPEREYIVAYAPGASIIDEETPEEAERTVKRVKQQIEKLLTHFCCEQDGDAMAMTVNITYEGHEAILFIPIRRKE